MIEDDGKIDINRPEEDADRYGEGLLYDLGKFLTTLSLLAIGGVLTVVENADRADIKTFNIIMITLALAAAALLAATTSVTIAYSRAAGRAVPANLSKRITATIVLLSLGLGMFIAMWIDKLV